MDENYTYEQLAQRVICLENRLKESKQIEKQIQNQEKMLKDILDNVSAWVWEVDSTGKYTFSSDIVKQILGYDPPEIIGKHFYDFFHPEDLINLKKRALDVFDSKKPFKDFINRNIHKDGSTVWLSTNGVPIFDENDKFIGYRGSDTDITDKYLSDIALRESEEHLRSLMESAKNFVVYRLCSDERNPHLLKVVFVSPSIEEILGIEEPMKFETWFENMHPEDIERISVANKEAFETFRFDEEYRTWNKRKGEWRWVHAISTGTRNEIGWTGYVNGIMIDITDRKRIEEALIEKDKKLEDRTIELKEMNMALEVLLGKSEESKLLLEKNMLSTVKKLTFPYVENLKKSNLSKQQQGYVRAIESSLTWISPVPRTRFMNYKTEGNRRKCLIIQDPGAYTPDIYSR